VLGNVGKSIEEGKEALDSQFKSQKITNAVHLFEIKFRRAMSGKSHFTFLD